MENTKKRNNYPVYDYKIVWEGTKWGKDIVVTEIYKNGVPTENYEVMEKWIYLQLQNQAAAEEAFWTNVKLK